MFSPPQDKVIGEYFNIVTENPPIIYNTAGYILVYINQYVYHCEPILFSALKEYRYRKEA